MGRAFYIIGIVFGFLFMLVAGFFVIQAVALRAISFSELNGLSDELSDFDSIYSGLVEKATKTAAMVSIFFFVIFLSVFIIGLLKVKTKVNKVFSIIGLGLSVILFLWNFMVLTNPGAISFDEVGGFYIFYALIVLVFSIVGLVQAIRYLKTETPIKYGNDLLDS